MRYLDGLAVDELLARTDASGDTSWYFTNQIGSVVAIASTTAGVQDEITYDPFGNIVTQTDASEADRFLFAGMEYDPTTGIYYDHARYYDAAIGRFVEQDPKGFAAGDTNLYRYVGNDPVSSADPSGDVDEPLNILQPGPKFGNPPPQRPIIGLPVGPNPTPTVPISINWWRYFKKHPPKYLDPEPTTGGDGGVINIGPIQIGVGVGGPAPDDPITGLGTQGPEQNPPVTPPLKDVPDKLLILQGYFYLVKLACGP